MSQSYALYTSFSLHSLNQYPTKRQATDFFLERNMEKGEPLKEFIFSNKKLVINEVISAWIKPLPRIVVLTSHVQIFANCQRTDHTLTNNKNKK